MLSHDDARRVLASLIPQTAQIDSHVEVTARVERLIMRSRDDSGRTATVSRADLTQYTLMLDGEYMRTQIDEDLTDEEAGEVLAKLVAIGEAYILSGAEVRASRWLRVPYKVIRVGQDEILVYRVDWDYLREAIARRFGTGRDVG